MPDTVVKPKRLVKHASPASVGRRATLVEQLQRRQPALETVSQEMGHFRAEITETYLR